MTLKTISKKINKNRKYLQLITKRSKEERALKFSKIFNAVVPLKALPLLDL